MQTNLKLHINKNGSNYNLIPYSQDELKNNVNQLKDERKTNEEEKKYSIKKKY